MRTYVEQAKDQKFSTLQLVFCATLLAWSLQPTVVGSLLLVAAAGSKQNSS